jgi:glycosyltransferase involved in cell wall biosynthesis
LFERHNLRHATAVCYTCEEEQRLARTSLPGYRAADLIAGLGIQDPITDQESPPSSFEALNHRFPALADRSYLLFLGRIHPKKGLAETLRGYAASSREYPNPAECPALVITGPIGDDAHAAELTSLVERSGLPQVDYRGKTPPPLGARSGPIVIWLPMLHGEDKDAALAGSDALVLCSHQENFGIVVAEALAHSKPVLLSRAVNIWREVLADSAGFADEDAVEGATRLFQAWRKASAEERFLMGQRARRCFTSRFEVTSVNRNFLERIQNLGTIKRNAR